MHKSATPSAASARAPHRRQHGYAQELGLQHDRHVVLRRERAVVDRRRVEDRKTKGSSGGEEGLVVDLRDGQSFHADTQPRTQSADGGDTEEDATQDHGTGAAVAAGGAHLANLLSPPMREMICDQAKSSFLAKYRAWPSSGIAETWHEAVKIRSPGIDVVFLGIFAQGHTVLGAHSQKHPV